jgi:hypothetical protein
MKMNKLGTLAILAVVASFTAACNGSPTKSSALAPLLGDGGTAAPVNVTAPIAAKGACVSQPEPDPYAYQTDDASNVNAPSTACVPPATTEAADAEAEAQADVVLSEALPMDDARFAKHLDR